MKYRTFAALLTAAVLALTLLAGCAGNRAENHSGFDLTQVNEILEANGCKGPVTASGRLERAVEDAAQSLPVYGLGTACEQAAQHVVKQAFASSGKTVGVSLRLATAEQLEAGVKSAWLGTVHTPEEIAADVVLSMNGILKQVKYEAAAVQTTTQDGASVWVIAVIYYLNH